MPQFSAAASAGAAEAFPEPFIMYLTRFMLRYDERTATWYGAAAAALPASWDAARRRTALAEALGAFGMSLSFRLTPLAAAGAAGAATLFESLQRAYARDSEAANQLTLLFSLLSPTLQPVDAMRKASGGAASGGAAAAGGYTTPAADLARLLSDYPDALLPASVVPEWNVATKTFSLPPAVHAALLGGSTKAFGAVGRAPLSAERVLGPATYGLFALSGGFGCSITHLCVVPLDVVKTRLQTRPGVYSGFADALNTIRRDEGWRMLLQGAQATGAGYFMYGVSVYPGYELAKRLLFGLAGPTAVMEFRIPLVLLAGALATVVTCFLITPFEAVRIRMVECPGYAPNFAAAVQRYTVEGGWASLYDGLIPLLVRQVLFGMVKFLIFDTCADAILAALPAGASDDTFIALGVSLISGAIAGVGAAVISQPADVVLSKVAQGDGSKDYVGQLPGRVNQLALLQQTAKVIIRKYGIQGLYLGLVRGFARISDAQTRARRPLEPYAPL